MTGKAKSGNDVLLTLYRVYELTAEQETARRALSNSIYPPDKEWAGRSIEWTPGQYCAICWDSDQNAVSHAGGVIRSGLANNRNVKIGGIGSVMTHADSRKQGLAARAIERLFEFFKDEEVDFALLVCEPILIPYYQNLDWQPFDGDLLVTQRGESCKFTFNRPMVLPVCSAACDKGVIDLIGPPW
ncbi:MAG: GNAT family N-acetyltransferase [Candidatus Obscuribacterales bacterium]|nr:GNAT family N-acetyltransferase [Candidatus Obscuribacterales bacterium]